MASNLRLTTFSNQLSEASSGVRQLGVLPLLVEARLSKSRKQENVSANGFGLNHVLGTFLKIFRLTVPGTHCS